jgi:F-type H+-transporting ATPase subunit b
MELDISTLVIQAVNALVLIWLLSRFLFKPVARMIEGRRAELENAREAAASAREEAERERAEAARTTAALSETRRERLEEVEREAQALREEKRAAATADADRIRESARQEVEELKRRLREQASERAATLSVDIAARLLERLPPQARAVPFLDGLVEAIASLRTEDRLHIAGDRRTLTLRTPVPLGAEDLEHCRREISGAIGGPVELVPEEDASLVAGLELSGDRLQIRNSFRRDLDELSRRFAHAALEDAG